MTLDAMLERVELESCGLLVYVAFVDVFAQRIVGCINDDHIEARNDQSAAWR